MRLNGVTVMTFVIAGLRSKRMRSLLMTLLSAAPFAVFAAPLPVPCTACGAHGVNFAVPGVARIATKGNTLTVTQNPARAILNWQSFNIAKGNAVRFKQPSSNAIALNRIFQNSPSEIFGSLNANGQVYLINQNGIVFGRSAQVNTQSLVASSLDMDDHIFNRLGITGAINDPSGAKPAFAGTGELGAVSVEAGAKLTSAEGGRILLLAPRIDNCGSIETPGGQAIAAAAQDKVYLAAADGRSESARPAGRSRNRWHGHQQRLDQRAARQRHLARLRGQSAWTRERHHQRQCQRLGAPAGARPRAGSAQCHQEHQPADHAACGRAELGGS